LTSYHFHRFRYIIHVVHLYSKPLIMLLRALFPFIIAALSVGAAPVASVENAASEGQPEVSFNDAFGKPTTAQHFWMLDTPLADADKMARDLSGGHGRGVHVILPESTNGTPQNMRRDRHDEHPTVLTTKVINPAVQSNIKALADMTHKTGTHDTINGGINESKQMAKDTGTFPIFEVGRQTGTDIVHSQGIHNRDEAVGEDGVKA